jgi:hypothetical protein
MPEIRDSWNERLPGTWWSPSADEKGYAFTSGNGSGSNGAATLGTSGIRRKRGRATRRYELRVDRGGIQAKTAVSVEVSADTLSDSIDSIVAGPRDEPPALEDSSLDATESADDDEILGEIDGDELDLSVGTSFAVNE